MRIRKITLLTFAVSMIVTYATYASVAKAQTVPERCVLSRDIGITINVPEVADVVIVKIIKNTTVSSNQSEISGNVELRGGSVVAAVTGAGNMSKAIAGKWGVICLINTINTLTDWAFFILLTISFVLIAIAGFLWTTSGADAERQKKAGGMIAAALIGIVIAVIARVVPAVLTGILV